MAALGVQNKKLNWCWQTARRV